jgi:signal transduction histidine kinase
VHRALARRLLGLPVRDPANPANPARPGHDGWVRRGLRDPVAWRAVGYLLLKPPLAVLAFVPALAGYGYGIALLSYPAWWRLVPAQHDSKGVAHHGLQLPGEHYLDTWPRAVLAAAVGAALLVATPWLVRALLAVDRLAVRQLLGPSRLTERVRDLEQTRAYAVADSAAMLRRIERDLHDGAQARLVALAMNLGAAKEHLDETGGDPRSRQLVGDAHRTAKEALTELRDLARGIHPPVLDAGLDAALATLAVTGPVPVDLRVCMPGRPSAPVETIAYFCVAELLTNVAKHSGARRAAVDVERDGDVLRIRVTDQGRGGATARPGGGLAGLVERVRTVDGRLTLTSPPGGPTVATVELPCGS